MIAPSCLAVSKFAYRISNRCIALVGLLTTFYRIYISTTPRTNILLGGGGNSETILLCMEIKCSLPKCDWQSLAIVKSLDKALYAFEKLEYYWWRDEYMLDRGRTKTVPRHSGPQCHTPVQPVDTKKEKQCFNTMLRMWLFVLGTCYIVILLKSFLLLTWHIYTVKSQ